MLAFLALSRKLAEDDLASGRKIPIILLVSVVWPMFGITQRTMAHFARMDKAVTCKQE